MIQLYYNNNEYLLEIDGERVLGGVATLQTCKEYTLFLCPFTDGVSWIPRAAKLNVTASGELQSSLLTCKVNSNEYMLLPLFVPAIIPSPPEVLIRRSFDEHTVTIYHDSVTHFLIENADSFETVILPETPNIVEQISTSEGVLFIACGDRSVAVVLFDYIDYHIILDIHADEVVISETGINIVRNLCDSQGRVVHEQLQYNDGKYLTESKTYEYKNAHKPNIDLIAYDFIESVVAGDFDYSDKVLNIPDMDSKTVYDFLEEFNSLVIANKPIHAGDRIILSDASGNIRSYTITIADNKIVDIDEN